MLLERLRLVAARTCSGQGPYGGWLFPGMEPTDHVTARQLNRAVHLAASTAGINKRITPHGLSHAFATHASLPRAELARRARMKRVSAFKPAS